MWRESGSTIASTARTANRFATADADSLGASRLPLRKVTDPAWFACLIGIHTSAENGCRTLGHWTNDRFLMRRLLQRLRIPQRLQVCTPEINGLDAPTTISGRCCIDPFDALLAAMEFSSGLQIWHNTFNSPPIAVEFCRSGEDKIRKKPVHGSSYRLSPRHIPLRLYSRSHVCCYSDELLARFKYQICALQHHSWSLVVSSTPGASFSVSLVKGTGSNSSSLWVELAIVGSYTNVNSKAVCPSALRGLLSVASIDSSCRIVDLLGRPLFDCVLRILVGASVEQE